MSDKGILEVVRSGDKGQVLCYVRPNRRSPARDFRDKMNEQLRSKYNHIFRVLCSEGLSTAARHQSLAPLLEDGKGLWSFKANDHRFYAFQMGPGDVLVLLDGFIKDASDTRAEARAIARALKLKEECLACVDVLATPVPYSTTKLDSSPLTLGEVFEGDLVTCPAPRVAPPPVPEPPLEGLAPPGYPSQVSRDLHDMSLTPVTVSDLVERTKVPRSTIMGYIWGGKLPVGEKTAGLRGAHSWPGSMLDELVSKIRQLVDDPKRKRPGEQYKVSDGVYACPRCKQTFASGPMVFGHLASCKPVQKVERPPAEVQTRKQLLKMAEKVIDGKSDLESFESAVVAYNDEVMAMESKLRRLKGGR